MLTQDALQFISAFAPIISKAAMQTYYSALPLMPSASLLSKKYSAVSRPSQKLLERIINHPQVMLPKCLYTDCTTSDGLIALSHKGGITFFDTRTGNETGSRIPTPDQCRYHVAFSPDGKWIAIQGDNRLALEIWDVKTCTCVKTIETKSKDIFERITYSADGEKVMAIAKSAHSLIPHRLVFILDVKTDKPLKQLEVEAFYVAISSNGSQIAIKDMLGIKTIDVSTGHIGQEIPLYNDTDPNPRIVWSPNGQFLASASVKPYKKTKIYSLSLNILSGNAQVPSLIVLESSTRNHIHDLACTLDSSKVVAVLWDHDAKKTTIYICCTQSGALIGTSSFNSAIMVKEPLSFATDGQDIRIFAHNLIGSKNSTLHHFSIVPTHLETYMNHPQAPKFHPSQIPHIIQYSHHISGAIDDYASHIDADGWILNTKGGRKIWTPWANFELLCSFKPPQKGQTQYRTLEVKDPKTKTIVLIYVIPFEEKRQVNKGIKIHKTQNV